MRRGLRELGHVEGNRARPLPVAEAGVRRRDAPSHRCRAWPLLGFILPELAPDIVATLGIVFGDYARAGCDPAADAALFHDNARELLGR